MPESYEPLNGLDLEQFDQLTAQEGHTIEGQIKRLNMIEPLIRQRLELREKARRRALASQQKDDREIDAIIAREFQVPRFEYIKVDGQVAAVIVEKSSLPTRLLANYTVMMPAHVDTIVPTWSSYRADEQSAEPDEETGRIQAVGVWDEGAAVANGVAIMADLHVPEGMRVYGVFVRGEEAPQSFGAEAVISQWNGLEEVDLVISSEIGPLAEEDKPARGDTAMRYIIARPGRARMKAEFEVLDDARGHGSIANLANAQTERDRFQVWTEEIFNGDDSHGFEYGDDPATGKPRANLIGTHPLLGAERIDTGQVWKPWDGRTPPEQYVADLGKDLSYTNPDVVHSKYYVRMVPPTSIRSMLETQRAIHGHIASVRRWTERGILSTLGIFEGEKSYPPFAMPPKERNRAVAITHAMLTKVAGVEAVPVRGESVADENLWADELRQKLFNNCIHDNPDADVFVDSDSAVISIAPHGNHSHSPNEWVSVDDMARVRHAIMRLLRDPDGFAQLAKQPA